MKILFVSNTSWSIYNFRLGLIIRLLKDDFEVLTLGLGDGYQTQLNDIGCKTFLLNMNNKNKGIISNIKLLINFFIKFKQIKPDLICFFTIKPNIFGSLAASVLKIPYINNITGLGSVYIKKNITTKLVSFLYRISLYNSNKIFFQNNYDQQLFVENEIVNKKNTEVLPGSGIDLTYFTPIDHIENESVKFLMIGRVIFDKGIQEYVEAANIVKLEFPDVEFQLVGDIDEGNPTAVPIETIEKWQKQKIINYFGKVSDTRPFMAKADCIVLPSYREGTSRVLIEAAAMAKPAITTDVPGCNNIVKHNLNGLLCDAKNSEDLAKKMIDFLNLSLHERNKMGLNSREEAEKYFDEKIIIEKYLQEILS